MCTNLKMCCFRSQSVLFSNDPCPWGTRKRSFLSSTLPHRYRRSFFVQTSKRWIWSCPRQLSMKISRTPNSHAISPTWVTQQAQRKRYPRSKETQQIPAFVSRVSIAVTMLFTRIPRRIYYSWTIARNRTVRKREHSRIRTRANRSGSRRGVLAAG